MIYQTNKLLSPTLNHYGCAFTVLAAFREVSGPKWRVHEFGAAWHTAVDKGLVTADLNADGDMDDDGEAEITDWQALANFLGLKLQYLGKKRLADASQFDGPGYWVLTSWHNDRTGFTHWVRGRTRPVDFDPIQGGSITVQEGYPMELTPDGRGGLRVFKVL